MIKNHSEWTIKQKKEHISVVSFSKINPSPLPYWIIQSGQYYLEIYRVSPYRFSY